LLVYGIYYECFSIKILNFAVVTEAIITLDRQLKAGPSDVMQGPNSMYVNIPNYFYYDEIGKYSGK